MSIHQRTTWASLRVRFRELLGAPMDESLRLEQILRARSELAAAHGDLLAMLPPAQVADVLGDPDRVAVYAETLAAEAEVRDRAGELARARALWGRSLAVAREARARFPAPDAPLEELVRRLESRPPDG